MPANESIQDKQLRVRPGRVMIKTAVQKDGAIVEREIPFVMGIMADLSGDRAEPLPPLAEREFNKALDKDNFDKYMASTAPRLALKVSNEMQKDGSLLGVELNFKSIDDFDPEKLVENIEPLRELIKLRRRLVDLKLKVGGNEKLENLLQEILKNTETMKSVSEAARRGDSPATDPEVTR